MSVQEMKPIKEGKVREIYDNGDTLIMVATDRISCFDVILDNTVTKKGTVLTQMSKFWFDMTARIFQTAEIRRQQHDVQEAEHAPHRVHRSWIHYRKRLGKLQEERYRMRYQASGRSEGGR